MRYKVKDYRERLGMTQEQLSRESKVSRTIISGLESGKEIVTSTDTLIRLAKTLKCSVSDIFLDWLSNMLDINLGVSIDDLLEDGKGWWSVNNLEYPREPQIYPKDVINIPINVEVEKLDKAIEKAKELISLLKEAKELTNSLSEK